ncbi:MAG: multiheme c-type cytochrome ExtKL [Thermodesulfovibrionales bacterium]|nr:multiheme c-type cytochrome ExtKL [Thermodesulfovibrionales bacterium]
MRFLKLILVLLFIAVPLVASAEKAKTIDELAKMYDSSSCKGCHEDIYKQWEKSHHARPLMGVKGGLMLTPLALKKGEKGATAFSEDDPKKMKIKNYPCFKCHLPQAVTSAEDSVAVELTEALLAKDSAKVAKLQITCLVCHNEKAIIHKRELGEPKKDVLYGKKQVASHMDAKYKKVEKSAIFKDSVFCGQCHGLGPNLEFDQPFQCANLYGSYLHSYVSGGGTQTCQDCHMQKGDHLIAPNWNDDKGTSELLAKAISLDVQTLGYEWLKKAATYVPKIVVNTKITTTAGHRIPDG